MAAPRLVGYVLCYLRKPAGLAFVILIIVCLWLIWSLAAEYAKHGQPAGAAAPAGETVAGAASAAVARDGPAGEAPQKVPLGWHFVEWPLDAAALAAWRGCPEPSGSPEQTGQHGSSERDGRTAIPVWLPATEPALEPTRYKTMGRIPPRGALAKLVRVHRPIW